MIEDNSSLNIVCISTDNPNVTLIDEVPRNNELCIPVSREFTVLPPFPNPANDHLTLQMVLPADGEAEIILYDYIGQLTKILWRGTLEEGVQTVTLPIAELRNGTYAIHVQYNRLEEVVRFVKMRQ